MEGVTQTWKITRIDAIPQLGTLINIVNLIEWALVTDATAIGGQRHVSIGQTILSLPSSDNYTPLEDLTREQVWTWVEDIIGTTRIKEIEAGGSQYAIMALFNEQNEAALPKPETITNLSWVETID
jgi:hypothetical protein